MGNTFSGFHIFYILVLFVIGLQIVSTSAPNYAKAYPVDTELRYLKDMKTNICFVERDKQLSTVSCKFLDNVHITYFMSE